MFDGSPSLSYHSWSLFFLFVFLMFRDEILDKADCIFYSLRIIRTFLLQMKEVQKDLSHSSSSKNHQESLSRFVDLKLLCNNSKNLLLYFAAKFSLVHNLYKDSKYFG